MIVTIIFLLATVAAAISVRVRGLRIPSNMHFESAISAPYAPVAYQWSGHHKKGL